MSGKRTNGWYVFTQDAGEYQRDWSLSWYPAADAEGALRAALDTSEGHGHDGHPAVVVHEDDVHTFMVEAQRGFDVTPHASRAELLGEQSA